MSYTVLLNLWRRVIGKMGAKALVFTALLAIISSGHAAEWDYRDIFSVDHVISFMTVHITMQKINEHCKNIFH